MTMQYKQHVFKTNGIFTLAYVPPNGSYFDAIVVGGGASGFYNTDGNLNFGGDGGQVVYKRVYVNSPRSYEITIGAGGSRRNRSPGGVINPGFSPGQASSISDVVTANGGANAKSTSIAADQNFSPNAGFDIFLSPVRVSVAKTAVLPIPLDTVLVTDGLFADNTVYYSGGGGGWNPNYNLNTNSSNGIGFAGSINGGSNNNRPVSSTDTPLTIDGKNNTGGGGAAGVGFFGGGATLMSGAGGSGIVIIRYPIVV